MMQESLNLPSVEEEPGTGTFMQMVLDATARGVVGFFRQSSDTQRQRHKGSQRAQEEHMEQLAPFGVTQDQVRVILAYGESGSEGMVRRRFQELKDAIRSGTVGLVLLARHDRLGRNTPDASEVFDLMVENQVLMMADGRIYDPSNEGDRLILGLYAQFAEYENRVRTRWMAVTRLAKAKNFELRIPLPPGLTWADPCDLAYRRMVAEAGLSDWLEEPLGKPCSEFEGAKCYILPYPDSDVATAMRLLREWLLETRSVLEVERRISAGEGGWPHPGKLPATRKRKVFPRSAVEWVSLRVRGVRDILTSAAMFGCYRYNAPVLRKKRLARPPVDGRSSPPEPKRERHKADVEFRAAFRSWFKPEEERVVRRILSGGTRKPFQRTREDTRSHYHAIGTLRCSHLGPDGLRCGRRLQAVVCDPETGRHEYRSDGCRQRSQGHYFAVSAAADENLIDILLGVFQPDTLKFAAAKLRVEKGASQSALRDISAEIVKLNDEREAWEKLAQDATAARLAAEREYRETEDPELALAAMDQKEAAERYAKKAGDCGRKVRERTERAADQERRLSEYGQASEEEFQKCVDAAADLPSLIERARTIPGALQRIVECLTTEVFARRLGRGFVELTVEFPSGESVVRVIREFPRVTSQPIRILVFNRKQAGFALEDISAELAAYPHIYGRVAAVPDADDIKGILIDHEHFETENPRDGDHLTVKEIAETVGVPADRVMAVALAGFLGPARWGNDQLSLQPTEAELHKMFPEFALAEVARMNGFERDDLLSGAGVYRANRNSAMSARTAVNTLGRYHDAAGRRYCLRTQIEDRGLSTGINQEEREKCQKALANAVERLGTPDLRWQDFHPQVDVVRELGARFPILTHSRVRKSITCGLIPAVRCLSLTSFGRLRRDLLHVYAPQELFDAQSESVVIEWLTGGAGTIRNGGLRRSKSGRRTKTPVDVAAD